MAWSRISSRRLVLGSLMLAPVAALLGGARRARAQENAGAAGMCVTEDDDGLAASFNYVPASPHAPEKTCRTCAFWTAAEGGDCGECAMLHRPTASAGYCDFWAPPS